MKTEKPSLWDEYRRILKTDREDVRLRKWRKEHETGHERLKNNVWVTWRDVYDGNGAVKMPDPESPDPSRYSLVLIEIGKAERHLADLFALYPRMSEAQKIKLVRLNLTIEEGETIKGWAPRKSSHYLEVMEDLLSVWEYTKRFGSLAAHIAKRRGYLRTIGKRTFVHCPDLHLYDRLHSDDSTVMVRDYRRRDYVK